MGWHCPLSQPCSRNKEVLLFEAPLPMGFAVRAAHLGSGAEELKQKQQPVSIYF